MCEAFIGDYHKTVEHKKTSLQASLQRRFNIIESFNKPVEGFIYDLSFQCE